MAQTFPGCIERRGRGQVLRLTRKELYDLVWSKPMTEIAATYRLRDIHVAKACDKNDIPRPPAGYWQKRAHNKSVARPALSEQHVPSSHPVEIDSTAWLERRGFTPLRLLGKSANGNQPELPAAATA